jgi:hypothetical protein
MHFSGGGGTWSSPFLFDAVIVGVGNDSAYVNIQLDGSVLAICQNKGGNAAPGRNYVDVSVVHNAGPFTADQNGRVVINDEEVDEPVFDPNNPDNPSPKEAGCPNGNWKVVGYVPDTQAWYQLTAFASMERQGTPLDTLVVPCFTTFEPDGTTSGFCGTQ